MISEDELKKANERGKALLKTIPLAKEVVFEPESNYLRILLSNDVILLVPTQIIQGLENARPEQLTKIEIYPKGLGIHFPALDADVYIPALLQGFTGSEKWMASQMGRNGGRSKSKAKSEAARQNGKLGGRPKKVAAHG